MLTGAYPDLLSARVRIYGDPGFLHSMLVDGEAATVDPSILTMGLLTTMVPSYFIERSPSSDERDFEEIFKVSLKKFIPLSKPGIKASSEIVQLFTNSTLTVIKDLAQKAGSYFYLLTNR